MQFHYDKTLKQKIKAMTQIADETPAWLTICLAKSLKEWLGQSCRVSYQDGKPQLQLGYEVLVRAGFGVCTDIRSPGLQSQSHMACSDFWNGGEPRID